MYFSKMAGVACPSCIYIEGRVCYVALESIRKIETSHDVDIRTMRESNMTMTGMDWVKQ